MSISKNQVTAKDIDVLFQKTWCDECVDGGHCPGCLVYEALEAANKLTPRTPDAATPCAECGALKGHFVTCSQVF